jgi:tRNA U34 5-methylaminomethyl-2-thiouridine-forming methyltransferase MnmC
MISLLKTQDGSHTVFSGEFNESYHSKYGAVQESRHVFIEAGLFFKSIQQREIKILEMGFGTGLNALLTFLEAARLGLAIRYEAVEAYPLPVEFHGQLNYPELLGNEQLTEVFQQIHQAEWEKEIPISDPFCLLKHRERFEEFEPSTGFDLVYFDAFAPTVQPELWSLEMMRKMFAALKPGGLMVSYCAKGAFKRALKDAGFKVEALQGPPGKREMTRAIKP